MKPSLAKLYKFFKLEIDRNYDNHAVMGGLDRILDHWENEAQADELPQDLMELIVERLRDYPRLSPSSRAETLQGLWKRIQREEGIKESLPSIESPPISKSTTTSYASSASSGNTLDTGHSTSVGDQATFVHPEKETGEADGDEGQTVDQVAAPSIPEIQTQPKIENPKDVEPAALNAPVTVLPGVGAHTAQNLAHLGIHSLHDLLYYLPRRYDDYSRIKPINRLVYGDEVTVIGTVSSVARRSIRGGKDEVVEALIGDGTGILRITWFNQTWIARRLNQGSQIVLSGKIDQYLGRLTMNNPEWEPLEQLQLSTNRIVPVYPSTAKITQRWLRRTMNQVLTYWAPRLQDPLPEKIRQSAGLPDIHYALIQAHFPNTWDDLNRARQRLAFEEIFLLQLGVLGQKRGWQANEAVIFKVDQEWLDGQIERIPFELTSAQSRVISDIQKDLASGHPMNRLIQGDVGSGKTVVAALAIAIVTRSGAQAALMAPTSILAEQHYRSLTNLLSVIKPAEVDPQTNEDTLLAPPLLPEQICLLIGSTPAGEKELIRQGLADGSIKLVIGTHALLEDPVQFNNLQLSIIDEQHRFGVEQRAILRAKGQNPHLLVMTATPIPRSLALTVYGDLDLSVIDEMPPGRQPVGTYVLQPIERERAYRLIRTQVEGGLQAFIIYPLIEENENSDTKAAVAEYQRLQGIFPDFKLGLLHGRMRPDEKDEVMTSFRDREFQILISTSVVEVGVDIPNATVMLIEGANRFGLAQLHQFRGRVGRGSDKSFCVLIPDTANSVENERLKVMEETNDGFILAERDLEQRGPGQFLGTRQSGFSELKVANLTDVHIIEKARRFAQELFQDDPELIMPHHQLLKSALRRSWGELKGDIS